MNYVYYDEKCPLCCSSMKFVFNYVKPFNTEYRPLQGSSLSSEHQIRAMRDMLMVTESGMYLWGLDTYIYLFKFSRSPLRLLWYFISKFLDLPFCRPLSLFFYRQISDRRPRCTDTCFTN